VIKRALGHRNISTTEIHTRLVKRTTGRCAGEVVECSLSGVSRPEARLAPVSLAQRGLVAFVIAKLPPVGDLSCQAVELLQILDSVMVVFGDGSRQDGLQ